MRAWVTVAGSLMIVTASFVATDFLLTAYAPDFGGAARRDRQLASDAAILKTALEKYRTAKGHYPPLPDNDVKDLRPFLVDTGYLSSIPVEPLSGRVYRYTSRPLPPAPKPRTPKYPSNSTA